MESKAFIGPADSEISLEVVQKLVATVEGDPRTLPALPGRIILENGNALAKSYRGEVYYQIIKTGNGWQCGCPAGQNHKLCKHVKGLVSYLERTTANSPSRHEGESLQQFRQREAARILAEDEEKLRAYRAKIAAIDRQAAAKRRHRYHTSAPAPMATASLIDASGFKPCLVGE